MAGVKSLIPLIGGAYHEGAVLEDHALVVGFQRADLLEEPLHVIGVLEDAVQGGRLAAFGDQVAWDDLDRGRFVSGNDQGVALGRRRRSRHVPGQAGVHAAVFGDRSVYVQLLLLHLDAFAQRHAHRVPAKRTGDSRNNSNEDTRD